MKVYDKELEVRGRLIRIGRLAAEGFQFLEDPEPVIGHLREAPSDVDLFTFMQRLPYTTPKYHYRMEWDNFAVLQVSTFEQWWTQQLDGKTRNMVRRAEKKGVVVREVPFDAELVRGIWEIYNECPARQGRPFPHYGKSIEAVRSMSETFLQASVFLGAFFGEKLIGFMKLTQDEARSQAAVMHILAMIKHRDKAPANALVAQAVRSSQARGIPYIVYSNFAYGAKQQDSLSDFKSSNGFHRVDLPRYYVPITPIGSIALSLGLHHPVRDRLPESLLAKLRGLRGAWHERRSRSIHGHEAASQ